jgi:hypothetical protein
MNQRFAHEKNLTNICRKSIVMSKKNTKETLGALNRLDGLRSNETNFIDENLPWAITVEEFRKSGNFEFWTNKTVKEAIRTLMELTIIAYNFQPKSK